MSYQRRFSKKDIIKRRMEYLINALNQGNVYNFKKQAIKEYKNCLSQRDYVSRKKQQDILQKIDSGGGGIGFISRIAVSITNRCSLKCRDCNNLMPYCKEHFTGDVSDQIKDLKTILRYVEGIINVELIGGEPFVYSQLDLLLQYVCNEPKIMFVEVTTNGTIVPSAGVTELLKHPKVCVMLSDYGQVNSERAKKTYRYLKRNHVCVKYLKNRYWIFPGGIESREKSRAKIKYEYFHCFARKDCRTLYNGKLYVCGRAPVLNEIGVLKDNSSFLDIRHMNLRKTAGEQKIKQFFENTYADACNYCDCSSDKSCWVESGIQV